MLIWMLRIAGVSLVALGLLHGFFPKRFAWKEELARLSLLNRQIFYVHCAFLVMILVMMGLLSIFYAPDLLQPAPVNKALLGGLALFWGVRLFAQWFVYSPELWRGNLFNTVMHWAFTGLWGFYAVTYGMAWAQ